MYTKISLTALELLEKKGECCWFTLQLRHPLSFKEVVVGIKYKDFPFIKILACLGRSRNRFISHHLGICW